jgi:N-hydroxyarylamine O-acetyltransferase
MNRTDYLTRIGLDTPLGPDLDTLRLLQMRHLLTVPFENLDIHWKRPIILDTEVFCRKIVEEKRGGFCYELNGAFNELLRDIGFETRLVSARVFNSTTETFSPEFDHMTVIVTIGRTQYLTDVGFGDFTSGPLRIDFAKPQTDREGTFRVERDDDGNYVVERKTDSQWVPAMRTDCAPRDLSEFSGMCRFHQTSPESHFTRGMICSLMTDKGRKTLTGKAFIVTGEGTKMESSVRSQEEFDNILYREFDIRRD